MFKSVSQIHPQSQNIWTCIAFPCIFNTLKLALSKWLTFLAPSWLSLMFFPSVYNYKWMQLLWGSLRGLACTALADTSEHQMQTCCFGILTLTLSPAPESHPGWSLRTQFRASLLTLPGMSESGQTSVPLCKEQKRHGRTLKQEQIPKMFC